MAALPYMQLYVADYLADTAHLSTVEHGAYLLLIFNYWQRGESFKAKDEQSLNKRLSSVARLSADEWNNVKTAIEEFFVVSETEWRHERIERDLESVSSKSTKASNAGKASGARRRASKDDALECHEISEHKFNERPTDVQQTLNHTDTDTDSKPNSLRELPPLDQPKEKAIVFKPWLSEIKARGERAVTDYKPIWRYCDAVKIPSEWIEIAWALFVERYSHDEKAKRKRYIDWRGVFLRAVKGNWFGLWYYSEKDGQFRLTSVGVSSDITTRDTE